MNLCHTSDDIRRLLTALSEADADAMQACLYREGKLTKPGGSLGRLEEITPWLAGWQRAYPPDLSQVRILVFAGNHGVTAHGVSPYPATVTAQMVANFRAGGAAINQLARVAGADLGIVSLELDDPTGDITDEPAMTEAAFCGAFNAGIEAVGEGCDLLALGEMGIGNTTIAAALAAAITDEDAATWVGAGTGLGAEGIEHKAEIVKRAVTRHTADQPDAVTLLQRLGGREVAAIAGAIVAARLKRTPVLLDGFVVSAAALVLKAMAPNALDHCLASHRSGEQAHGRLLEGLGKKPLLDLGMRLGEGSGAALAIPLIRASLACHRQMATFDEAGVSDRAE
ncbi:MAG: nicotinate-nucleotide--dimethylbenzimidazole phosphoribosyltransferase [Geminicoccaceae bacterium]